MPYPTKEQLREMQTRPGAARTISITDEQLRILAACARLATPWLPEKNQEEAKALIDMIDDTVKMPPDSELLHGFAL